jgi:hypothetical protein
MFFYMLETHTLLSMHYYSWSFVCVTFHVITWLLSFIVKIMSFMPMFRVLWSQHSMLYIVWSRLCWCMSPQKLLFCYHLPTRGWAGVKLGNAWYVSNVSIIFDAPCLFMHHLRCVLLHFVTSQDFIKFWGNFLFLFCLYWLKFHRDLKNFVLILKLYYKNYFKLSIISWRTLLNKKKSSNIILVLFKPMQAYCKGMNHKCVIYQKYVSFKTMIESGS